jgi:thiol-disulfide isomerase/thioredoxin
LSAIIQNLKLRSGCIARCNQIFFYFSLSTILALVSCARFNSSVPRLIDHKGKTLSWQNLKEESQNQPQILIFFNPTCPICQYQVSHIKSLTDSSLINNMRVMVVVSDDIMAHDIVQFKNDYTWPSFSYYVDRNNRLAQYLGATTTPEAIIWDPKSKEILYQGMLDDAYTSLGRKKTQNIISYLDLAINQISKEQKVQIPITKAIGCRINY